MTFKNLSILLSNGGDDRTLLDINNLNKYYTSTFPKEDSTVYRGNCTSSTVWKSDLEYLSGIDTEFIGPEIFDTLKNDLKSIVLSDQGLGEIITAPSGTDLEYIFGVVAFQKGESLYGNDFSRKVYSVVSLPDEVGSGTRVAAGMLNFSEKLPSGENKPLSVNLTNVNVEVIDLFLSNQSDTNLKNRIIDIVKKARDEKSVCILHYVESSKTGVEYPKLSILNEIQNEFSENLVMLCDAAQGRGRSVRYDSYLERNWNVVFTGSKFYGAPPFCGAALICAKDANLLSSGTDSLIGLSGYFDSNDLSTVCDSNFMGWSNNGLLLRWLIALNTIKRYSGLNVSEVDELVVAWRREVSNILESKGFNVRRKERLDNSIITFSIPDYEVDSIPKLKSFFKAMMIGNEYGPSCEIGQPVKFLEGDESVCGLRIALGAKNIIEAFDNGRDFESRLNFLISSDLKLISKLVLIVK